MKLKSQRNERSETEISKEILDGLEMLKIGSFNRINNGAVYDPTIKMFRNKSHHSPDGLSDIIGCLRGRYGCIEVKTYLEYLKLLKFFDYLLATEQFNKDTFIITYKPENKWEQRACDQMNFMYGKIKEGGFGFFTFSLQHTLEKLKEIK